MGRTVIRCGAFDILYPWPTLAVVLGSVAMVFVGLLATPGEPNVALVVPAFFLLFAVLIFQMWAMSNASPMAQGSTTNAVYGGSMLPVLNRMTV